MAEFQGIGYGIGEALSRAAENLSQNARLQLQERDRLADRYAQQAQQIADNIPLLGGPNSPDAQPYLQQLKETLTKHNALFGQHETSTLVQRLQRLFSGRQKEKGQHVPSPTSVPGMQPTTGELLPGQLDTGQGDGETVSLPLSGQREFVAGQQLLPRTAEVAPPGTRPPLEWLSPEEMIATARPKQNAILEELQNLRQAFKAGGQSEEEAGKSAMTALQNKYGTLPPAQKPPRIERDPVTRDVISVTDETSGNVYNSSTIQNAPANVQQAWNAAQQGQEARPAEAPPSVKTEFELYMRDHPNATAQDWAEFKAKEARKGKTRKEQIVEEIADAYEKGDRSGVKRLQGELMAIDPAGAERLAFAAENVGLREAASVARQEAAIEKRVSPLRSIVETGANARRLKQMADAGNSAADVDLTLEFFKVIRGADGSGIRFSRNEQDFITGARGLSESLEVRGNQVLSNGQPLSTEQRQRMIDVIDTHASAAQRRITEIQAEEPVTPASLKERAKPRSVAPKATTPASEKESLLEEINK